MGALHRVLQNNWKDWITTCFTKHCTHTLFIWTLWCGIQALVCRVRKSLWWKTQSCGGYVKDKTSACLSMSETPHSLTVEQSEGPVTMCSPLSWDFSACSDTWPALCPGRLWSVWPRPWAGWCAPAPASRLSASAAAPGSPPPGRTDASYSGEFTEEHVMSKQRHWQNNNNNNKEQFYALCFHCIKF